MSAQQSDSTGSGSPVFVAIPEDETRAQIYRLLARFLSDAPEKSDLEIAAGMSGDDTAFGKSIATFARLAGRAQLDEAAEEYHDLFIGVARGELVPYGSYYLTGFLNEKPLALLRISMDEFGIGRAPDNKDPEDHIGSVLEMMAGIITGDFGRPFPLDRQKQFFEAHLGPWAPYFFRDLEGAKSSVLYAPLGALGRLFIEIEEAAFKMG